MYTYHMTCKPSGSIHNPRACFCSVLGTRMCIVPSEVATSRRRQRPEYQTRRSGAWHSTRECEQLAASSQQPPESGVVRQSLDEAVGIVNSYLEEAVPPAGSPRSRACMQVPLHSLFIGSAHSTLCIFHAGSGPPPLLGTIPLSPLLEILYIHDTPRVRTRLLRSVSLIHRRVVLSLSSLSLLVHCLAKCHYCCHSFTAWCTAG